MFALILVSTLSQFPQVFHVSQICGWMLQNIGIFSLNLLEIGVVAKIGSKICRFWRGVPRQIRLDSMAQTQLPILASVEEIQCTGLQGRKHFLGTCYWIICCFLSFLCLIYFWSQITYRIQVSVTHRWCTCKYCWFYSLSCICLQAFRLGCLLFMEYLQLWYMKACIWKYCLKCNFTGTFFLLLRKKCKQNHH